MFTQRFLAFCAALSLAGIAQADPYRDPDGHYEFESPAGWKGEAQKGQGYKGFSWSNADGSVSVSVLSSPMSDDKLEVFAASVRKRQEQANYTDIQMSDAELGGQRGKQVCSTPSTGRAFVRKIFAIRGDTLVVLTFRTENFRDAAFENLVKTTRASYHWK